jgi:tetratricopeptide (TPR) repeat protein
MSATTDALSTVDNPEAQWHFHGARTPFVGRVKELHSLREALRNIIDNSTARSMLLIGDAGMGKSRLMAEFTDTAEEHVDKVTVVSESCRPEGGPPYSVFARLIRQRFYAADESAEVARARILQGLSGLLGSPELGEEAAHFIGYLVGMRYPRSKHILKVDADARRIEARAVEMLIKMLRADAARAPLIITIDNLHLASAESLSLVLRLAEGLSDAPVLLVGAARPVIRDRHRDFCEFHRRGGQVVDVKPLADRAMRRLLQGLLARAADVPEGFAESTAERAFGNPLSLEQILKLQIERGAIEIDGDGWIIHRDRLEDTRIPRNLRDVVRSKLARLRDDERAFLERAAAVGEVFWSGAVEMLWRIDDGPTWDESDLYWNTQRRSDELGGVLETLRKKEIILKLPQSAMRHSATYTFKHILEREVLYGGIEGPRRARYHRAIAQWLESQGADDSEDYTEDYTEQIAEHWERGHNPRKAASWYVRAGERALARHLNEKAAAFFLKANGHLTEDDRAARIDVHHHLGKIAQLRGDFAEALGHFQEMLRLAWLQDDVRAGGLAYNKMGQAYRALGEYDFALSNLNHGLALFRRAEDVVGIASSADDKGRVFWMKGDLEQALSLYEEGLRLRRYLGNRQGEALSLHHIGTILIERGDFKEAVQVLKDARGIARELGDLRLQSETLNAMGIICAHRGEHKKAITLWGQSLEMSQEIGLRNMSAILLNNTGEAHLHLGELEKARDLLRQAVDLLEALGDRRSLSDALRNLAETALRLDDFRGALDRAEQAVEVAEELGARGPLGMAERALGEICSRTLYDDLAQRDARIATAEGHFVRSLEELGAVGAEAELGKSLLSYGSFLAEIDRADEARERLDAARALFTRLSMKEWLERTDRLLDVL